MQEPQICLAYGTQHADNLVQKLQNAVCRLKEYDLQASLFYLHGFFCFLNCHYDIFQNLTIGSFHVIIQNSDFFG